MPSVCRLVNMNNFSNPTNDPSVDPLIEQLGNAERELAGAQALVNSAHNTLSHIRLQLSAQRARQAQQPQAPAVQQPMHQQATAEGPVAPQPASSPAPAAAMATASTTAPHQQHPGTSTDAHSAATPLASTPPPARRPAVTPQAPWYSNETTVIRLVAIAGAILTIFGIGFLVALAVQRGLLGPVGRTVLAYTISALLVLAAFGLNHKAQDAAVESPTKKGGDSHGFAIARSAFAFTGFITAIITTHTITGLLEWMPSVLGEAIAIVLVIASLVVAKFFRSDILLIISGVSGFVALTAFYATQGIVLVPMVFIGLLMMLLTRKSGNSMLRNWATGLALVGTWVVPTNSPPPFIYVADSVMRPITVSWYVPLSVAFAVGLTLVVMRDPRPTVARTEQWSAAFVPALILIHQAAYTTAHAPLSSISVAKWWLLWPAVAAAALLLVAFKKAWMPAPTDSPSPAAFVAPTLANSAIATWLVVSVIAMTTFYPWVTFLACIAVVLVLWKREGFSVVPWLMVAVAATLASIPLGGIALGLTPSNAQDLDSPFNALSALVLVALVLAARSALKGFSQESLLIVAPCGLWLFMVAVVTLCGSLGYFLAGESGSKSTIKLWFMVGHACVSITWLLLAAYLMLGRRFLNSTAALVAALVLAAAGAAKLIFFDLGNLSGVPRVLAFILGGLALLGVSALRSSKKKESAPAQHPPS